MAIKPRGKSFQAVFTLGEERFRRSFKSYAEAEQWELESQLRFKQGLKPLTKEVQKKEEEAKSITWKDLRTKVINSRWKGQKSETTHKINSQAIIEMLGEQTLVRKLTQSDIDEVGVIMRNENEEVSPATLNRKYSSLSVMIKYAIKRGYLDKDFEFEVPRYKEAEHRIRWITDEEEDDLIMCLTAINPLMADIVQILIDTGLRLSELWRLKVADVTEKHLTVWESKGGKPRSVPLTYRAREKLKVYKGGKSLNDVIFEDMTNWRLTHFWNRAREQMGLTDDPQWVPHTCRHTFCSRLVQRGVPITHVQRLAGHSVITTTLRYAHLSQDDLDQAISVLEKPTKPVLAKVS